MTKKDENLLIGGVETKTGAVDRTVVGKGWPPLKAVVAAKGKSKIGQGSAEKKNAALLFFLFRRIPILFVLSRQLLAQDATSPAIYYRPVAVLAKVPGNIIPVDAEIYVSHRLAEGL
jgi:hypothetical protein